MGFPQAPWTDIGSLQNDISALRSEIRRKAESYEINKIVCRLDTLEHTCREISSKVVGFEYRLQELEQGQDGE